MTLRRSPEKAVEKAGDELMAAFGFTAIRFSQARATMQTRGIPDRRYYRAANELRRPTLRELDGEAGLPDPWNLPPAALLRSHVVWFEAKAGTKQSVHQKAFQNLVESCGERYVCGGVEALETYLVECGLAARVAGGLIGIRQTNNACAHSRKLVSS